MEKPIAAVEFGSKKLKLVVGYELQGQVYVLYALTRPYGHMIESGSFLDMTRIASAVKEIREFTDASMKLKLSISEACLALPPYGLEVYQNKQVTAVIGEESKVDNLDIRNVYALIRSGSGSIQNELIDIVPENFMLDEGRSYTNPPFGVVSSSICVDVKVHTLPKHIQNSYGNALRSGDMSVKRMIVAPHAASQLIATDPEMPQDYLLVDIGSNTTTVSLIGQTRLYCSRFFDWGGDRITERIIERFNINESDAEKYKITYGIERRETNFRAPICTTMDDNGNEIQHYSDELNEIIKGELDIFTKSLKNAIDEMLSNYDPSSKKIPMVLIGGGSRLNGLVEYLTPKVSSEKVICWISKNLGARNPTFVNCLGMILANAKNPSVYDESHPRVGRLTRDEE